MTKKEQIEQTSRELFLKHGFKKVSIDEVCKNAGVSRKTFYTYFQNKNDLVLSMLTKLFDEAFSVYQGIIDKEISFAEKIKELFAYKFKMVETSLTMEFVKDFYHPDSVEILDLLNKMTARSMILMRDFFENGKKSGEMNSELNIDFVMYLMQKAMDMCGSKELQDLFPDAESMTRQVANSLIYGIMPLR